MKVNFGDYIYFDNIADNQTILATNNNSFAKKYAFDETKFNKLIANRQYNDAADYASQFHFNDPETQKAHENDIINLSRNGRVLGAIYGRINNDDDLKKIEFYDKVFVDGGLEQLNTFNKNNSNYNNYAAKFIEFKEQLGNELESTGWHTSVKQNGRKAKGIKLHFAAGKKSMFGIDWLAADNQNTIEEFYNTSNLTEQQLRDAGVNIIHKDGYTELKFDKSNKLANTILFNIPTHPSLDTIGNGNIPVGIIGYDDEGDINYGMNNLYSIQYLLNTVKTTKEDTFKKLNLETRQYSSSIGPMISDELSSLKSMLNSGQIDETQYNRQAKAIAPHIFSAINTLGSSNYEMYTNYLNEEQTDETLIPVENKDRADLVNLISSYAPKDIDVSAMVSNGKIGTLITLEGTGNESKDKENDGRRIQIFVPGLLQEEAQAKINRNTSTRAVQELNSMIDWGYSYKLRNGSEIGIDNKGQFIKDKKVIDKQSAIQEINKDMIMEESLANLKFQYMNSDGNITDNLKYEEMSKLLSMKTVSDVYGDINLNIDYNNSKVTLLDKFGNVYNPDDIFDRKINKDETQYEVYDRLDEIYSLYNELMNELTFYK